VLQSRGPPRLHVILQTVRTFGRWDCINARQRERPKKPRFAACTSRLTSPATRRPPPKCGAFRLQPRGSPLRQTGCWSEPDSNCRSRSCKGLCCWPAIQDAGTKTKPVKVGSEAQMAPPRALSKPFPSRWDHEFESVFLQRRVSCEPDLRCGTTFSARGFDVAKRGAPTISATGSECRASG
jgi:hypothetical protein